MRQITLKPLKVFKIPMELHEVESSIPCGFRMEWLSGEDDAKVKFSLRSGAGCGSPYMTFNYGKRDFIVDMRPLVKQLLEAVNNDMSGPSDGSAPRTGSGTTPKTK